MNNEERGFQFYVPKNIGVPGKMFGVLKRGTFYQILGIWLIIFLTLSNLGIKLEYKLVFGLMLFVISAMILIFLNNKRSLPKLIKHFTIHKLEHKIFIQSGYLDDEQTQGKIFKNADLNYPNK